MRDDNLSSTCYPLSVFVSLSVNYLITKAAPAKYNAIDSFMATLAPDEVRNITIHTYTL